MDPLPSDTTPLQPLNPLGHQFVGKFIDYKWPQTGWCVGRIKEWNSDPSVRIWRRVANFEVFYDCDRTTVTQLLSPDNYNADGNGLAPVGSWVFLSYDTPIVLPPPYIPSSDASSPAVDGPETSDQADLEDDNGGEEDALDRSVDSLI